MQWNTKQRQTATADSSTEGLGIINASGNSNPEPEQQDEGHQNVASTIRRKNKDPISSKCPCCCFNFLFVLLWTEPSVCLRIDVVDLKYIDNRKQYSIMWRWAAEAAQRGSDSRRLISDSSVRGDESACVVPMLPTSISCLVLSLRSIWLDCTDKKTLWGYTLF